MQCIICCSAKAVMQVSPCGHEAQCRLCFVRNIQGSTYQKKWNFRISSSNLNIMNYRVAKPLKEMGWVDFDFGCSSLCLVLLGLM